MASNGCSDHLVELHANGEINGVHGTWPKPATSFGKPGSLNLATEQPLTKEELVAILASGCKAKPNWRSDLDI